MKQFEERKYKFLRLDSELEDYVPPPGWKYNPSGPEGSGYYIEVDETDAEGKERGAKKPKEGGKRTKKSSKSKKKPRTKKNRKKTNKRKKTKRSRK